MESSKPDRFNSMIVALDFGPAADRILPIVGRMARVGGLGLQLVTTASRGLEDYDLQDLSARAQSIHGCPVTSHVVSGDDPAGALAELAGRQRDAMLCLASHGRTAVGDLILGSMTEELLRRHGGPMLAIGPDVPDDYELGEQLLVAIDEGTVNTALLEVSAAWQATFGGTIELFEAVTRGAGAVAIEPTSELRAAKASLRTARTTVVESHDPARAIGDAAMTSGSVIAVVGHARGGLERVVRGSVTGELLHLAAVPLLIVPS
jgi:nucleotide-binding universal stress UspA family protein